MQFAFLTDLKKPQPFSYKTIMPIPQNTHTHSATMAGSSSLLSLLLFCVTAFTLSSAATLPPNRAIHLNIQKDPRTLQYYIPITLGGTTVNVVLDLGGQETWFNCANYNSSSYRHVPCDTNRCKTLGGVGCVSCNGPISPGCTNNTCGSSAYNPFRNLLYGEGYGTDTLSLTPTDGKSVFNKIDSRSFAFSCANPALLRDLARQTIGMVGLSKSRSSLIRQLFTSFKLPNKFALCLPTRTENGFGDVFVGGGPYIMQPVIPDLATLLTKTPLLINPVSTAPIYTQGAPSDEYFINVRRIKIDGVNVPLNTSLLTFDSEGNGGTKLSTIARYTVLHNSIYRAIARSYISLAARKNIVRVAAVRPFGICFNGKAANGSVPHVHLVLHTESVMWGFDEANLMVKVTNDVMCLAITDGGLNPRTAIVLGGYQLENYLLEFDLASSNLGFSSSLLQMNSSCSHSRVH